MSSSPQIRRISPRLLHFYNQKWSNHAYFIPVHTITAFIPGGDAGSKWMRSPCAKQVTVHTVWNSFDFAFETYEDAREALKILQSAFEDVPAVNKKPDVRWDQATPDACAMEELK